MSNLTDADRQHRQVSIILLALVVQTTFLAIVFTFLAPIKPLAAGPPPEEPIVSWILSGIALVMIPLSWFARRALLQQHEAHPPASEKEADSRYIARYLVPAAILEAGSLKSLVGYILEGQTFSVVVAAVLAGFILSDWPIQPTPTDTQSRDFA
jgi:hypothetical protein